MPAPENKIKAKSFKGEEEKEKIISEKKSE
jgi:hypothetical protein